MKRAVLALSLAALALGACRTGDVAGNLARAGLGSAGAGAASDVIAAGVTGFVDTAEQINTQFSPEQEYYLGRAVAANVIAQYGLDPDEGRQAYVRRVGATLVTLAPRIAATHGGYHFAVLASPSVNGLSGPGGFVFVTRGALDACRSEDQVAGLLAHEIAHVSLRHGESVIRTTENFRAGAGALGRVVGAAAGSGQFESKMYDLFSSTAAGFARDLADRGYGPELEYKADTEATYILYFAGYDAGGLAAFLRGLPSKEVPAWTAHPGNADRAERLAAQVSTYGGRSDAAGADARHARFAAATGAK